ncbi:hypothetical protein JANAI62_16380 [Jannaschia pagri]|uniref:Uncharacterized protein n=1 Tax=Jannaschia pagri TaxID=2829797 RepID=A0ABQ4NKR6_9RHOB|nr:MULTISPECIES: hypothetical protein [unclassified Jannaschia]GIT91183.1 hypothetical protein JANAI61_16410 [Jannaschia sp. AI_61]GIT95015.1 hypothetical protein JANAI62_16380 [Jannaschia sp. AI_62]
MAKTKAVAVLALLGVVSAWLLVPWKTPSLRISGDGAPGVEAAMPGQIDVSVGDLDVVLLRRAENLRHMEDVARLCRGRCDAALTSLYELRPGGGRKILVFDLAQIGGAQALDRGAPLPDPIAACLADRIAQEATGIYRRVSNASCVPTQRWLPVLPYGL